jgi:hypothetical protein
MKNLHFLFSVALVLVASSNVLYAQPGDSYWRGEARPFAILETNVSGKVVILTVQNVEADTYRMTGFSLADSCGSWGFMNGTAISTLEFGGGGKKIFRCTLKTPLVLTPCPEGGFGYEIPNVTIDYQSAEYDMVAVGRDPYGVVYRYDWTNTSSQQVGTHPIRKFCPSKSEKRYTSSVEAVLDIYGNYIFGIIALLVLAIAAFYYFRKRKAAQ